MKKEEMNKKERIVDIDKKIVHIVMNIIFFLLLFLVILGVFSTPKESLIYNNEIEEGYMFSIISNRSSLNLFYNGDITYSYYNDEGEYTTIRVRDEDFIKYFKETYREIGKDDN